MSPTDNDHPFRDQSVGAKARRIDLLRRRRDDLANMPFAVRRVYVSRMARIWGTAALCVGGAVLVAAAASTGLFQFLQQIVPGNDPAALSTTLLATWIVASLAYLLGRCVGEARFTQAMSSCVLPTDDLHTDVERLSHIRPEQVAETMAHRLEPWAAFFPMTASGLIVPATLAYAGLAAFVFGYPDPAELDSSLLSQTTLLGAVAAGGAAFGLLLAIIRSNGRKVGRTVLASFAMMSLLGLEIYLLLDQPALLVPTTVLMSLVALLTVRRLNWERRIVDLKDDSQTYGLDPVRLYRGAVTFFKTARATLTFANAKRVCRQTITSVRDRRSSQLIALIMVVAVIPVAVYSATATNAQPEVVIGSSVSSAQLAATTTDLTQHFRKLTAAAAEGDNSHSTTVQYTQGGRYSITFTTAQATISIADIQENPVVVPSGWQAVVDIRLLDTTIDGGIHLAASLDSPVTWERLEADDMVDSRQIIVDTCDGSPRTLSLTAIPDGAWTAGESTAELSYIATLQPADCPERE